MPTTAGTMLTATRWAYCPRCLQVERTCFRFCYCAYPDKLFFDEERKLVEFDADVQSVLDSTNRLGGLTAVQSGRRADHPCLRRVETLGGHIVAHIATGPPVGGAWAPGAHPDGVGPQGVTSCRPRAPRTRGSPE